jgi:hypothetical protein
LLLLLLLLLLLVLQSSEAPPVPSALVDTRGNQGAIDPHP